MAKRIENFFRTIARYKRAIILSICTLIMMVLGVMAILSFFDSVIAPILAFIVLGVICGGTLGSR